MRHSLTSTVGRFIGCRQAVARVPRLVGLCGMHTNAATPTSAERLRDGEPLAWRGVPMLHVSDPGSFAELTLRRRVPAILSRLPARVAAVAAVQQLCHDLTHPDQARVAALPVPAHGSGAVVVKRWNAVLGPFVGRRVSELPFAMMECWMYQALAVAMGGPLTEPDAFADEKEAAMASVRPADAVLKPVPEVGPARVQHGVEVLLAGSLWANQADLSLWSPEDMQAGASVGGDEHDHGVDHHHSLVRDKNDSFLMVNDLAKAAAHIVACAARGGARVDIVLDNYGPELVSDLRLAHFLLHQVGVECVVFHAKSVPVFVSDTTGHDMARLFGVGQAEARVARDPLLAELRGYHALGRFQWRQSTVWQSNVLEWPFAASTIEALVRGADVTIVKGDANGRKLVGDRDWQRAADEPSFAQVTSYFPCPAVLGLRTLKSEAVAGVPVATLQQWDARMRGLCTGAGTSTLLPEQGGAQYPLWRVNGSVGVAQFRIKE